jgi:TolB-like protein/DNA-binding winged helix-turn-helix (wHTH) protein
MAGESARLVARFDGWTLRRAPLELYRGDQPVRLQEQPLQVLEALLQRPGELVTREGLAARLWPDTVVDVDAGLNTAVRKLRAALADDPEAPKYLETVPRQGYRFIGRIEPVVDAAAVGVQPLATRGAAAWPRRWTLVGLALVGLAAAAAWAVVLTRPAGVGAPDGQARPTVDRLAVLPFESLSPDPANAFFADGMHEEPLSELGSRARRLEVISRTTMLTYRGRPTDVRALARDLGATHVLEGSVRREGNTVRVSLQLVNAAADRQLWSRSYQSTLVDAMTLKARLAREVAEQLAIQLPAARAGQVPPPRSPEAYDEWLKGTLAWQGVGGGGATAQEIDRVEAMFTRAIALDATYGAAYADRARVRIARYASHADGREANLAGARADIALAQQYAGGTPYVLVRAAGLVFLVDRDLPRALGLIEAAEQVGPLDAGLLLTKGNFLMSAGRLEESLAVQREAARLDPGNAGIYRYWVSNLAGARRPAEAIRVLRDFDSRYPGRLYRGEYLFGFAGSTARWWDEVARLRAGGEPNATLSAEFDLLRCERRFAELHARLDAVGVPTFAQHSPFGGRVGASVKPVAELRGWERLLAGDPAAAAREGRALAAFVDRLPQTPWNAWWRQLLGAESAVMLGEHTRAIALARAAADPSTGTFTFPQSLHVRMMAARVLAWAGDADEAMALLEALAHGYPGAGPASIVRDPFFTARLSSLPRWGALQQAMDAEIAANQALLR